MPMLSATRTYMKLTHEHIKPSVVHFLEKKITALLSVLDKCVCGCKLGCVGVGSA